MLTRHCLPALLAAGVLGAAPLCPRAARAQDLVFRATFGVMQFGARAWVDFVDERIGAWNAVPVVVIWRGQPQWVRVPRGVARGNRDAVMRNLARVQAAKDSARRAGGVLAGHATDLAVWTVGYDPAARRVDVLGRGYPVPSGDSTLVLVVDRADSVGGAPAVVATAIMTALLPGGRWRDPRPEQDTGTAEERVFAGIREFRRRLATHPVVGPYIE